MHTLTSNAKPYTANSAYSLGIVTMMEGFVWYRQHKFEEARSEVLRATEIYEKLGAADDVEKCREFLQDIEEGKEFLRDIQGTE
jgi:hypothetical protein